MLAPEFGNKPWWVEYEGGSRNAKYEVILIRYIYSMKFVLLFVHA